MEETIMASFKQYTTKSGKALWRVSVYAGLDPKTDKKKYLVRGGFDTRKKATLAGAKLELAISKGDFEQETPKDYFYQDVFNEWWDNYINTVRESTRNRVTGYFHNHILPEFGNKKIAMITTRDVQKAVKKWFKQVRVNYRRWFVYASGVFEYAVRQGYIKTNPANNVVIPKREEQAGDDKDKFWDKDQLTKFFSCIDPNEHLDVFMMFRLFAYTGVRRGELLALEYNDVDFNENTITINKTLTQGDRGRQIIQAPKTKASRRTIPVDAETMQWLRKWRAYQKRLYFKLGFNTLKPHQLIFSNTKNGYHSLNTPAKRLRTIIDANHLTPVISVHKFRHSFISNALMAGVPVSTVQKLVGHSSPATTLRIYAHINQEQARKATDSLAKYLEM